MSREERLRDVKSRLRRRAETLVRRRARAPGPGAAPEGADLRRLIHELEVHQVELEMQNRELLDAQAALLVARDRYASLFDLAPVAYLVLDAAGTIRQANNAACALLDRPRHRLLRSALSGFVAPEDRPALARHLEEAATAAGPARPLHARLQGPWGRAVRLETVRDVPGGDRHEYRTAMIDLTERVQAEERLRKERVALERSQAALRALTRKLMVAEESERRRIAADLHDDIGQRLHAVQMDLALLRRRASGKADVTRRVEAASQRLAAIVGDLGGLARHLHPKIVDDLGLRVALRAQAEELGRQAKVAVRLRERDVPGAVPPDVAICLYRVAQEALRNVQRHAATRAVTMTLARAGRGLGLCVADAGRGFDPQQARLAGGGLGLVTMQERVNAFHGLLRVRARPGRGTHVHAWVPLP